MMTENRNNIFFPSYNSNLCEYGLLFEIPGVFIGRRRSTGGFAESDFELPKFLWSACNIA